MDWVDVRHWHLWMKLLKDGGRNHKRNRIGTTWNRRVQMETCRGPFIVPCCPSSWNLRYSLHRLLCLLPSLHLPGKAHGCVLHCWDGSPHPTGPWCSLGSCTENSGQKARIREIQCVRFGQETWLDVVQAGMELSVTCNPVMPQQLSVPQNAEDWVVSLRGDCGFGEPSQLTRSACADLFSICIYIYICVCMYIRMCV